MTTLLKIYGIPNSQPVRAIVWPCLMHGLMHGLSFEFVLTAQNTTAKTATYLEQVNPRGTVPAIDDEGVVLWESHAILIYLCEQHGWVDLWPNDLVGRARINQYSRYANCIESISFWAPVTHSFSRPKAAA